MEWKNISINDSYVISNTGLVKSKKRKVNRKGKLLSIPEKILKQSIDKNGYIVCNLYKNGDCNKFYVHRLVAQAFLGDPPSPEQNQVAHWDGDKTNNNVENLRWCSIAENNKDCIRLGRNKRPSGTNNVNSKLTIEDLKFIKDNVGKVSIRKIAKKLNVTHGVVCLILKGKTYKEDFKNI